MPTAVIAIDGPAASGKSTVASRIADVLGIPFISTGDMYRAVTYFILTHCHDLSSLSENDIISMLDEVDLQYHYSDSDGRMVLFLNSQDIRKHLRSPQVSSNVSKVSALPAVRQWLLDKQRKLAEKQMVVMEGRDIGTVVFPEAEYKFFLTASPEVRATRRLIQGGEAPEGASVQAVAAEIAERDRQDMTRELAPLKKAEDALVVDSSDMDVTEVIDFIIDKIKHQRSG